MFSDFLGARGAAMRLAGTSFRRLSGADLHAALPVAVVAHALPVPFEIVDALRHGSASFAMRLEFADDRGNAFSLDLSSCNRSPASPCPSKASSVCMKGRRWWRRHRIRTLTTTISSCQAGTSVDARAAQITIIF